MSEETKLSFVGHRISMKQSKLYKATSEIMRMNEHKRKNVVTGIPKLERMRGLKEIVSGLAIPRIEK